MPLVKISLVKGKTAVFKKHVSQSIHQALVSEFGIPDDDLFQTIEELDSENLIFPDSYMGISHSHDIIYIVIIAKKGRTVAMKQSLFKKIVENIAERTGHDSGDVVISMLENAEENWSFGHGEAQLVTSQ